MRGYRTANCKQLLTYMDWVVFVIQVHGSGREHVVLRLTAMLAVPQNVGQAHASAVADPIAGELSSIDDSDHRRPGYPEEICGLLGCQSRRGGGNCHRLASGKSLSHLNENPVDRLGKCYLLSLAVANQEESGLQWSAVCGLVCSQKATDFRNLSPRLVRKVRLLYKCTGGAHGDASFVVFVVFVFVVACHPRCVSDRSVRAFVTFD